VGISKRNNSLAMLAGGSRGSPRVHFRDNVLQDLDANDLVLKILLSNSRFRSGTYGICSCSPYLHEMINILDGLREEFRIEPP
jgi:hypothetical protein